MGIALLLGCGADAPTPPATKASEPTLPPDPTRLLTDAELATEADPLAPAENAAWSAWAASSAVPIRSLTSPRTEDLQFLKPLLSGKRLVQLGESGHGVAQFDQMKVRLIKFLHEEMGFDVIAFESGMLECWDADRNATTRTPSRLMGTSIFAVWYTQEVLSLFEYIKSTKATAHPLLLAGFDVQISSPNTQAGFLGDLVSRVDPTYAKEVYKLDSTWARWLQSPASVPPGAYIDSAATRTASYQRVAAFIERNAPALEGVVGKEQVSLGLRVARYRQVNVAQHATTIATVGVAVRDSGMADNLTYLLRELYPDKKIIAWAHNFHIRHDNVHVQAGLTKSMGQWLAERHRNEMYTIGLYMYRGTAAFNDRSVYDLTPASAGSLESILYRARKKWVFADLAGQPNAPGTSWMYQSIIAKDWGVTDLRMVVRDQYDGIVFIDRTTAPNYITPQM